MSSKYSGVLHFFDQTTVYIACFCQCKTRPSNLDASGRFDPFIKNSKAKSSCFSCSWPPCVCATINGWLLLAGHSSTYTQLFLPPNQAVSDAIRKAGVDRARLVIGVDMTASNEWQVGRVFQSFALLFSLSL